MRIKRIAIWYRVLTSLFATWPGVKSEILDAEATVDAIKKGRSLIRFGDGEVGIYMGNDIHYQSWSAELAEAFTQIKEVYERNADTCPYLLAVPQKFMQCSGVELSKKRVLVSSWARSRLYFKRNFNRAIRYGDSFVFQSANVKIYDRIWQDCKKTILFLHNNKVYADIFARKYGVDVVFIECPAKNAFADIDGISRCIDEQIEKRGLLPEDVQFVISAGPAGKVLVFKYSRLGYHCIDAGHCWDMPLES